MGRVLASSMLAAWMVVVMTMPVAGQALPAAGKPGGTTKRWVPPRTADGQPDLQGVWTNGSNIPLERPKNLGAKEFYTEQEAADIVKKVAVRGDRVPPPEAHYDLSQFGLETGQAKFAHDLRTSLIVGPDGRLPPKSAEGRKRVADSEEKAKGHEFDGPETRPLKERCIMWPDEGPPMLPASYNSNLQIVQNPGYVAIVQEMIHDIRIIPLDGRPHPPRNVHQWMGDSRGHWEGDTLVVDATNFIEKTALNVPRGYAIPPTSERLHVVERFTRTDPNTILYEFTVDDPATWSKAWTGRVTIMKIEGAIYEYACHEGNYGMANTLSGARAEEKAAGAAAQKGAR